MRAALRVGCRTFPRLRRGRFCRVPFRPSGNNDGGCRSAATIWRVYVVIVQDEVFGDVNAEHFDFGHNSSTQLTQFFTLQRMQG